MGCVILPTVYIPPHFRETDLVRLDWLAAHDAFGTLVSMVDGAPFATHLPVLYAREGGKVTLSGHWARPNAQWKDVEGQRALFMLHGPHTYISPRWYEKPEANVPTWNYAVAHLYGKVRVVREADELERIVVRLAEKYEQGAQAPWRYDAGHGRPQLRGIVGFEMAVDEIQVKYKLNQNHPVANVAGAIAGLEGQSTEDAREVAKLMRETLARRPLGGS